MAEVTTDRSFDMVVSLRKSINDKCKECIYDPIAGGGTWRQQVEKCTSPNCPLFEVRPRPFVKDDPTYRVGEESGL